MFDFGVSHNEPAYEMACRDPPLVACKAVEKPTRSTDPCIAILTTTGLPTTRPELHRHSRNRSAKCP